MVQVKKMPEVPLKEELVTDQLSSESVLTHRSGTATAGHGLLKGAGLKQNYENRGLIVQEFHRINLNALRKL